MWREFVPLLAHKHYMEHLSTSSYRFIEENYIVIIIVIELSPSPSYNIINCVMFACLHRALPTRYNIQIFLHLVFRPINNNVLILYIIKNHLYIAGSVTVHTRGGNRNTQTRT